MKKTKYLVLSAAAVLAVGCGSKQMPSITDEEAVATAGKIVAQQVADFTVPNSVTGTMDDWHKWEAPKTYVSVTATDSTDIDSHVAGSPFEKRNHTATRVLKFDLEAQHIQYVYDANFYYSYNVETGEEYTPGDVHLQYDYVYQAGKGLWRCLDNNGLKAKRQAHWGFSDWTGTDITNKDQADAWMKYAYVNASYLNQYSDLISGVIPIPSANHYMCGFDNMLDYFIDGEGNQYNPLGWQGLIDEDFDGYESQFSEAIIHGTGYYFDTFAQFINNSIVARKLYQDDFTKKESFTDKSSASTAYYSDDKEKNLAGEVSYNLDWLYDNITLGTPEENYGIDYSFTYKDNYLTQSKTKYFFDNEYLDDSGKTTGSYYKQSATKSVDISYDKPTFASFDLSDYEA